MAYTIDPRRQPKGPPATVAANTERLLKIRDVARRLNVGRTMVYELIRRRQITAIHIGRSVRFEPAAVDQLIQNLAADAEMDRPPRPTWPGQPERGRP